MSSTRKSVQNHAYNSIVGSGSERPHSSSHKMQRGIESGLRSSIGKGYPQKKQNSAYDSCLSSNIQILIL
jgi:hypothetical protein